MSTLLVHECESTRIGNGYTIQECKSTSAQVWYLSKSLLEHECESSDI